MGKSIQTKVLWFYQRKLIWGIVVMVLTQMLSSIPTLDMMPVFWVKLLSWIIGTMLTVAKGIEMFFDQSSRLIKSANESPLENQSENG